MCHRMRFESALGAASLEALFDTRTHGWFSDLRFFIKRAFDYVWYVSFFSPKTLSTSSHFNGRQRADDFLGDAALLDYHLCDLGYQIPLHSTPRRCPYARSGQQLSLCEGVRARCRGYATRRRVHRVRYARRGKVGWRVNGPY
jgi:hypothetical protein